jgi:hypothetical protein
MVNQKTFSMKLVQPQTVSCLDCPKKPAIQQSIWQRWGTEERTLSIKKITDVSSSLPLYCTNYAGMICLVLFIILLLMFCWFWEIRFLKWRSQYSYMECILSRSQYLLPNWIRNNKCQVTQQTSPLTIKKGRDLFVTYYSLYVFEWPSLNRSTALMSIKKVMPLSTNLIWRSPPLILSLNRTVIGKFL